MSTGFPGYVPTYVPTHKMPGWAKGLIVFLLILLVVGIILWATGVFKSEPPDYKGKLKNLVEKFSTKLALPYACEPKNAAKTAARKEEIGDRFIAGLDETQAHKWYDAIQSALSNKVPAIPEDLAAATAKFTAVVTAVLADPNYMDCILPGGRMGTTKSRVARSRSPSPVRDYHPPVMADYHGDYQPSQYSGPASPQPITGMTSPSVASSPYIPEGAYRPQHAY